MKSMLKKGSIVWPYLPFLAVNKDYIQEKLNALFHESWLQYIFLFLIYYLH